MLVKASYVSFSNVNSTLPVMFKAKIIDGLSHKLWPHVMDIIIEFNMDILDYVEDSLFKNLVASVEGIDKLILILMSDSPTNPKLIQAFRTFLQMSKLERYRDRAFKHTRTALRWGLLVGASALLVLAVGKVVNYTQT